MFKYIIIFLLLCAKPGLAQNAARSIIYEGQGIDSLKLGILTGVDVKHAFGPSYTETNHQNYSIELFYKSRNISFYYFAGADTSKIFAMSIYTNYPGKTSRGFDMRTMNVRDMIRMYGSPQWDIESGEKIIYARYMATGIYFGFKLRERPLKEFELYSANDAKLFDKMDKYYTRVYGSDKITEITIGKPQSEF
jgi:hypothetical protein